MRSFFPFLVLLALPALAANAQDESELDGLLRVARSGRTVVRPQAARRLVRFYEDADAAQREAIVERLLAECGETSASMAALGPQLVGVLGELDDSRLRARLWEAFLDPDFPWRPYAARSLAATARGPEAERFDAWFDDPIAPVRAAALDAFRVLEPHERSALVRERLADPDDTVRRSAADLLAEWGETRALFWLLEELRRDDTFFDRPTGKQARYLSQRKLAEHLDDLFGFDADKTVADPGNRQALERLRAAIERAAGEPQPVLPALARASAPTRGEAIGLELRSCRRGEFYLRWTSGDELLVGQGNPARVALEAGTVARLVELGRASGALTEKRFHGEPGCDTEHFHWRSSPVSGEQAALETRVWVVSKGPQAVEGLRPPERNALFRELLSTLPEGPSGDPRLARLRARATAAAESIGGPLEDQ